MDQITISDKRLETRAEHKDVPPFRGATFNEHYMHCHQSSAVIEGASRLLHDDEIDEVPTFDCVECERLIIATQNT
jgi:hypothetical protein